MSPLDSFSTTGDLDCLNSSTAACDGDLVVRLEPVWTDLLSVGSINSVVSG